MSNVQNVGATNNNTQITNNIAGENVLGKDDFLKLLVYFIRFLVADSMLVVFTRELLLI